MGDYGPVGVQILKIIWINILLSGDNAIVIALACRALPPRQRFWGIILGAGAAVLLRIFFTVILQYVLELPWLKLVGGLLLLWIAIKLLTQDEADEAEYCMVRDNLWGAVRTVAIADIVMSLDNVLAIAAAAKGNTGLIIFGLAISIPLIVAGATLIMALLTRYPVLVWAGAALLGWIAGELIVDDRISLEQIQAWAPALVVPDPETTIGIKAGPALHYAAATIGTVIVLVWGWMLLRRRSRVPSACPESMRRLSKRGGCRGDAGPACVARPRPAARASICRSHASSGPFGNGTRNHFSNMKNRTTGTKTPTPIALSGFSRPTAIMKTNMKMAEAT